MILKAPGSVVVVMRLPGRILNPNGRAHWRRKAEAVKAYRDLAHKTVLEAIGTGRPQWKRASALCEFYFRTRGRKDADNHLASMKPAFDGLKDAGLIEDDAGLTHLPCEFYYDKENPRVEITITEQRP